jgi:hypothetical protein
VTRHEAQNAKIEVMPPDDRPISLDHHATTAVDPRVLEAMLP